MHATASGVAAFIHDDEESCLADVRYLLSLLPSNNRELPPCAPSSDPPDRSTDRLLDIVPAEPGQPYDMHDVIAEIVDEGEFLEVHAGWATNVVCALARLDGYVTGIVANQPEAMAGSLDIHGSEKAARFVQTCDAFNIPLVSLVDVPGFLPGLDQEHGGITEQNPRAPDVSVRGLALGGSDDLADRFVLATEGEPEKGTVQRYLARRIGKPG